MDPKKIGLFSEKFFKNLNCEVSWIGDSLMVRKVNPRFEKFCGKKGPYKLIFYGTPKDEEILVDTSSFLLKAMNDYLSDRGRTTLLKINFNLDEKELISKKFPLMNCKIEKVTKSPSYNYFERFSFSTTYQYLNEKEQIANSIYVRNGEVFDFNLKGYGVSEGNRRDLELKNLEGDYEIAKLRLRDLTEKKTFEVKENLREILNKEIERIKEHFVVQVSEFKEEISKNRKQIEELENSEDVSEEGKRKKIENLKNNLEKLESDEEFTKAKKEENHFIKSEVKKHSLNIINKLINTAIVYYPYYIYNVSIKSDSAQRTIQIRYDPFEKEFSKIKCNSCGKEVEEIILCSSGHLTCRECGDRCGCCRDVFCKKCVSKKCEKCGETICSKCIVRCSVCGKTMCKSHGNFIEGSSKFVCNPCMKKCSKCGKIIDRLNLKKDSSGRDVCLKCYSLDASNRTLKGIFNN